MSQPKVCVIYYSMYGHIKGMAEQIKKGCEEAGAVVTMYQAQETLPEEVLSKMGAPGQAAHGDPVFTRELFETLPSYDAFFFGIPTRYGMMSAQMKAFFDGCGQLWQEGKLNGKPASIFCSVGTQGGGIETTVLTTVTQLTHLGMVFVPMGYTCPEIQFDMSEVHAGSPYGASTFAACDGSRMPSEKELALARHHGKYATGIFKKFA